MGMLCGGRWRNGLGLGRAERGAQQENGAPECDPAAVECRSGHRRSAPRGLSETNDERVIVGMSAFGAEEDLAGWRPLVIEPEVEPQPLAVTDLEAHDDDAIVRG